MVRKCLNCTKETKSPKFCSHSCAASFNNKNRRPRTAESRAIAAEAYRRGLAEGRISLEEKRKAIEHARRHRKITTVKQRECTFCKQRFDSAKNKSGHYPRLCSDECFQKMKAYNAKGIKRQEYNGQVFDSGYEVLVAKWLDEVGVRWERGRVVHWEDTDGKVRRYFPDFYLPAFDLYLDPKNEFCIQQQKKKLEAVQTKIKLVYGEPSYIIKQVQGLIV